MPNLGEIITSPYHSPDGQSSRPIKAHALIIDDNALNIEILSILLEIQGISHTYLQSTGDWPLNLDALESPDLIFLDLEMPHRSGYEMLALLKKESRFQDIRVIAYTVHISQIEQARQAGFYSFIGKPLEPERFAGQIARLLNHIPVWET